ncbi:hypothetical protein BP6252_12749 [Coleophoma cylindrospora]|uniref:laccase n=1 Tax=Coleophoma cylindrospora TaxID=1849047 RepID=A0A3D8QCS3_9HELO|nr:hypothetical protein BP6252_12749 [Coleophoma cylindrospora]
MKAYRFLSLQLLLALNISVATSLEHGHIGRGTHARRSHVQSLERDLEDSALESRTISLTESLSERQTSQLSTRDSPIPGDYGPDSRNSWGNWSIASNYEATIPQTGAVVEYFLSVENGTLAPDGVSRQVLTFNGSIPGPLITANWGDTIRVTVTNNLQNNGTSVHWHGFRQLNTNDQDGTNGITECPIAPGQSKTYEFVASEYGSSCHFSAQYGDGVVGPMVIKGPASANFDEDLGPVLIQDWFHQSIFQEEIIAQHSGAPTADNYLLNGINSGTDGNGGNRLTLNVQKGKKYLMRLINVSTDNFFKIGLDGHKFTVIAADFVPIQPFTTDIVSLGVGQRYDVIVEATADVGNYYLRAVAPAACSSNANTGLGTANGIFSYEGAPSGLPTSTAGTFPNDCSDLPLASLVPMVPIPVDNSTFQADMSMLPVGGPVTADTSYGGSVFTWDLKGEAIDVDWEYPTLMKVQNKDDNFTALENVVRLDKANVWTYWIIQNTFAVAHPMHLHGHDFSVLGQGDGTFNAADDTAKLNFANPARRDTAMLPPSGWTAIAFMTDNPGIWLFHCHIGWHVGGGLSLQFLERESDILTAVKIGPALADTCASFKTYNANAVYKKSDSGL